MTIKTFYSALKISIFLCVFRYICILTNLQLGYFNDIIFFVAFGIWIIFYQKRNKKSSFVKTLVIFGSFQVAFSILLYEITRLIAFHPDLTKSYWLNRSIVSLTVLVLGLIANFIFLSVYFLINKNDFAKESDHSKIIDDNL
ncbi:MAG: hypothetical protein ACO1O6_08355 [Bacteroidota bacterium]